MIFSCSDDDSDNNEAAPQESLIGTWTLSQEFDGGEEIELQACNDMFTLTFDSETRTQTDFFENDLGECVLDEILMDTYSATEDMITLFLTDLTVQDDNDDREVTFSYFINDSVLTLELGNLRNVYLRVED